MITHQASAHIAPYMYGIFHLTLPRSGHFNNSRTIRTSSSRSVCEVLHNPNMYLGKTIEVRGYWDGDSLSDNCEFELKSEEYIWKSSIYLRIGIIPEGSNIGVWALDKNEWNKAFSELARLQPGPVKGTIVGEISAKEELTIYRNGSRIIPLGFGPGGIYPVEMTVRAVKDIIK